ncbi:FAD/NAD(P)-binding domain-containing protein [Dichomitus squalens]|uniref:FAD/NAD(P)-binding domain-containing protein n=1 Tax=Dichomitus squalens TaxID=114155 RepID=A0A4Q9N1W5_9APHY|nr:FAD/NAD(P)-binding domain-containing protein [Dichomitus squalens]
MTLSPQAIASSWFNAFSAAFTVGDLDALAGLFLPDGWFRDLLVLTWDSRSLEGREKIKAFLSPTISGAQATDFKVEESSHLAPHTSFIPQIQTTDIEFGYTFKCSRGPGRGFVRLLADRDGDGEYRALTVMMMLSDLWGHEESPTLHLREDVAGVAGRNMQREFADWVKEVETKPYVLIVGAAQTGLHVAARFKQMGLPTLVIERTPRIGDVWRKRYLSLALHTPRKHHSCMHYQPFPDNWPQYTPRDKIADWLEQYAAVQDLVVWTSAELEPRPKYDSEKREWDVTIIRDGKEYKVRPAHIIMATGTLGAPYIPDVAGKDVFDGRVLHATLYNDPEEFTGKRVVVIGAGNTAIDICQDLALTGVGSVTMVQRSSTCVMSRDFMTDVMKHVFPEDVPLPIADFRNAGMPYGLLRKLNIKAEGYMWETQKGLHEKLRKGGIHVNMGPDGSGLFFLTLGRLGGQDKGGADLIAAGKIKVKHGVEIDHLTKAGVVFTDGSELPADVVILATGYLQMKETNRALLGDDIVDRTGELYGLDEEGELKASYRQSGHPGLWYATGDFYQSRFMSKILGLQLQARQLGIVD